MALALLPALLFAGDFFYWRLAVSQLQDEFDKWAVQAQASGWELRHGAITAGGWPDAATLRVEDFTAATAGTVGWGGGALGVSSLNWGSDAVLFRAGLTRPETVEVVPVGLHALRINNGPPIPVSADQIRIRLGWHFKSPPRTVDIDALALVALIPGLGVVSVGHLSAHAGLKLESGRDQAVITFSAAAQPVSLPEGARFGLGPDISDLALEGVLNGPWPFGGQDVVARATAWRDAGGSLDLQHLAIGWGQVRVDASATLALDEDLQPMGAGTGKIVGFAAALDALAENAVLRRSAAKAAKAMLSLLANTPGDGQPEEVEVPLTLQFRTLSVRQVPLVRLPALNWPPG